MITNRYYDEFIRYYGLAKKQQDLCNLGIHPYVGSVGDDLMEAVELYDVVERKYAGFSQIVHDCFYGWTPAHPYWHKIERGLVSGERQVVAHNWTGKDSFDLPEWLYVFLVHRITGSGINYAKKPSGYNNSVLFNLYTCESIEEMATLIANYPAPIYTSVGYQFPAFPKLPEGTRYKKAGDYYLGEFAPQLVRDLSSWLQSGPRRSLREVGTFMFDWNASHGLKIYRFQYAAFIADIADWFPEFVDRESHFYYGSNAVECLSYLVDGKVNETVLDDITTKIMDETGAVPYNSEDVACDFIRWVENYVKPGGYYDFVDRDVCFGSCLIRDHPFGRQRPMLQLGLVGSFNNMKKHPADDTVIREAGLTVEEYKKRVASLVG